MTTSPDAWALREEILDLAHAELQARLAQDGAAGVMDSLKRLWRHFIDRTADLTEPLDLHIQVAWIRALPADQRQARLAALLTQARNSPAAEAAMADLQRVLIEWRALGPGEAILLLPALPGAVPVTAEVVQTAVDEIRHVAARPTAGTLDALNSLDRRGLAPQGKPFADLLAADADVLGFVEATRSARFRDDGSWARQCIRYVGRATPAVVHARRRLLLEACLEFPAPWLGAAVFRALPAPLPRVLIDSWGRELGGRWALRAAVWGVYWPANPPWTSFARASWRCSAISGPCSALPTGTDGSSTYRKSSARSKRGTGPRLPARNPRSVAASGSAGRKPDGDGRPTLAARRRHGPRLEQFHPDRICPGRARGGCAGPRFGHGSHRRQCCALPRL